jgi:translation elongation factor EF-G
MSDGFVGKLVFVRIYSGTLKKGAGTPQSTDWKDRAHLALTANEGE